MDVGHGGLGLASLMRVAPCRLVRMPMPVLVFVVRVTVSMAILMGVLMFVCVRVRMRMSMKMTRMRGMHTGIVALFKATRVRVAARSANVAVSEPREREAP